MENDSVAAQPTKNKQQIHPHLITIHPQPIIHPTKVPYNNINPRKAGVRYQKDMTFDPESQQYPHGQSRRTNRSVGYHRYLNTERLTPPPGVDMNTDNPNPSPFPPNSDGHAHLLTIFLQLIALLPLIYTTFAVFDANPRLPGMSLCSLFTIVSWVASPLSVIAAVVILVLHCIQPVPVDEAVSPRKLRCTDLYRGLWYAYAGFTFALTIGAIGLWAIADDRETRGHGMLWFLVVGLSMTTLHLLCAFVQHLLLKSYRAHNAWLLLATTQQKFPPEYPRGVSLNQTTR